MFAEAEGLLLDRRSRMVDEKWLAGDAN